MSTFALFIRILSIRFTSLPLVATFECERKLPRFWLVCGLFKELTVRMPAGMLPMNTVTDTICTH